MKCDELKAYIGPAPDEKGLADYYLKSEADKVIAELKKERDWLAKDRAQAYDDLEKRAQLNIKQEESIRHSNHKRCLAMAKWCESENYTSCWYHENSERCEWTEKWEKRWLELAKEPTWAKFLQLIHKEAK